MGQYFRPIMIFEDGTMKSACSHDFNNGIKLMEHSWIGNKFVNAVLHIMEDTPVRIAWLGDYSMDAVEDDCEFGGGFITDAIKFIEMYNLIWDSDDAIQDIDADTPQFELDIEHPDCYLVNLTKKCYIDMEQYIKRNAYHPAYDKDWLWCVNPLPLLTCVGNGMGGGDYRSVTGIEDVGSWAFDEIYVTNLKPNDFEAVEYCFRE